MDERVGAGTWEDPIEVGRFPFVDRNTTLGHASSLADRYDCMEETGEQGAEVVYRFTLEGTGDLVAEVLDVQGADIDLHLLRAPTIENGVVTGCLGRAHQRLEVDNLTPGDYLLVADSWSRSSEELFEGDFEAAIDVFETGGVDHRWLTVYWSFRDLMAHGRM